MSNHSQYSLGSGSLISVNMWTTAVTKTLAQNAPFCPSGGSGVCYQINVPARTANSGNGDIFFQIAGPSTMQWIALGTGRRMAGSNLFVVYAAANQQNVTLSPRLASGYVEPEFNQQAQVSLLEGSGISNGKMTANVRCEFLSSRRRRPISFDLCLNF